MKSASAFVGAAILSVFAAGTQLSLTGQERSQESLAFTNLTLEIALAKTEFVPLEPIPILVTLSNATTKTVAWRHALTPNHTELFVISSGGSPKKIDFHKPIRELIEVSPYPKVLRPGDAENLKPLITMGLNDILSQPGDYRIQAVTHGANWNEEVRSKPQSKAPSPLRSAGALQNQPSRPHVHEDKVSFRWRLPRVHAPGIQSL